MAAQKLKQHFNIKRMSAQKKELSQELCRTVVTSVDRDAWETEIIACVKNGDKIEKLQPLAGVMELSAEHGLELYPAALVYHSKKDSQEEE